MHQHQISIDAPPPLPLCHIALSKTKTKSPRIDVDYCKLLCFSKLIFSSSLLIFVLSVTYMVSQFGSISSCHVCKCICTPSSCLSLTSSSFSCFLWSRTSENIQINIDMNQTKLQPTEPNNRFTSSTTE